ncbi:sensor histidine kinase [uncultured Robinsoniella sp.]|uniref:sensor histidine kinase n=1 Tax=uncultured Robinsoniella sp. TaxID=904190 RepID=UPI00374E24F2
MILLTIFITTALSVVIYSISKGRMEDNYKKTYENNLKAFSDVIDLKLYHTIDLIRITVGDQIFLNTLAAKNQVNSKSTGTYFDTSLSQSLDSIFMNVESQSLMIDGIFIFDEYGRYYKRLRGGKNASAYLKYYTWDGSACYQWMKDAEKMKGKETFYGYDILDPEGNQNVISVVKDIVNPATLQSQGQMVIHLNKSFLSSSLLKNDGNFKTDTLMVIDENASDVVVYQTGDPQYAEDIKNRYFHSEGKDDPQYLFTSRTDAVTGWKIVNGIARSDLSRDSSYIGMVSLIAAAALVVICTFISNFISKKINKPLGKLETVIMQVKEGNRHIVESFDNSEIGKIGGLLKETVNNNLELKEQLLSLKVKEREAELQLLQAQINPHFLYNTLDSIYCMAMIGNEDRIADMVSALSDTFKISLNNGKQIIPIHEEIKYIEKYMTIQNIRYEQRFDLILEIDEEIGELLMIKFILQPFIENSMYHGLEPKIGKGYIELKGERIENDIYFTISDNGVGMRDVEDMKKGFGVTNVIDRIHLFYGAAYGIQVESEYGVGTKVKIRIPVIEESKSRIREEGEHEYIGCD